MTSADTLRLSLLLAASSTAAAVDALAASGLFRPSRLFAALESLQQCGRISRDDHLEHVMFEGDADAVIAAASSEDLAVLLTSPFCLERLLEGARQAGRERRFASALVLYRALMSVPDPIRGSFPGGRGAWMSVVLEATRLFRSASNMDGEVLQAAIGEAEQQGDLGAQAVLLAYTGVRALGEDLERARKRFQRALDAADAHGVSSIRMEVHTYIAVSLVLSGRPGEGIAAFEGLLGDVPEDSLDTTSSQLLDLESPVPASALALLANAYATVGDPARAVDLMERVRSRGQVLGNRALEAMGEGVLALISLLQGDRNRAAVFAKSAWPCFAGMETPYTFACALCLSWVEAEQSPRAAWERLSMAIPVWRRTGRHFIGGSTLLCLLQFLSRAGLPPLEGLTLEGEIARFLDSPYPLFAGIAHRFAAQSARSPEEAQRHLRKAVTLLSEAGGGPELELACADARTVGVDRAPSDSMETHSTPSSSGGSPQRVAVLPHLSELLELGRLHSLPPVREGMWGEVVARLCRALRVERCALFIQEPDRSWTVLAARGASDWLRVLRKMVDLAPPLEPLAEMAETGGARSGQRIYVPFTVNTERRGVLVLENRWLEARFGASDLAFLRLLGQQTGILVANASSWREALELRQRLEQENRYHREEPPVTRGQRMVGSSAPMRQVLEQVRRAGRSDTPVLVTGETGVGKELVCRELHLASRRSSGPFIAVHIASLAPGLVCSALFGHERGAFTGATERQRGRFELAQGGTLLLDEVGELTLEDQVRLLRVLQEGSFERVGGSRSIESDFRLVAATHRDLEALVRAGAFREDLYYRLAAFPIRVPPLRERREEIPVLALFFLERASRKLARPFEGIQEADLERLCAYPWPGNVRELEHVIERAVLLSDPPRLSLPPLTSAVSRTSSVPEEGAPSEWVTLDELERRYLRRVLRHVHGRISGKGGAAEVVGLKPSTLQFRLERLGLREELGAVRSRRPRAGTKGGEIR